MPSIINALLSEIIRIGNSPINTRTISNLRKFHFDLIDFADSLVPRANDPDTREDFEDALNQLTEHADALDVACDDFELSDNDASKDEALNAAGEALKDVACALQDLKPLAQYIEANDKTVAARWTSELSRLSNLPAQECKLALAALLAQARTPKESSILTSLAKDAIFSKRRQS